MVADDAQIKRRYPNKKALYFVVHAYATARKLVKTSTVVSRLRGCLSEGEKDPCSWKLMDDKTVFRLVNISL